MLSKDKIIHKLCSALCLFFCFASSFSAVITLSTGPTLENNGRTQNVLLETSPQDLYNQYTDNNNWHSTLVTQLFLGKDFYQKHHIKLRSGLTIGYLDDIQVGGIVNQFALPQFNNLSYQYNVQSFSALATLKLLLLHNKKWQPYIDGGIGFSNNHSYGYQETPLIPGAVAMNPYGALSTNSFAYSLGAGVMYNFNRLFSAGLGYQFEDLGASSLGPSPASQTNQAPSLSHIYLQQILLNISWNI